MRPIRCYVAGPWADKPNVQSIADKLSEVGFEITSRWLGVDDVDPEDPNRHQYLQQQAIHDIEDLTRADVLVYVNSMKSEGKATELGMALATAKPIIVIGDRSNNVFLNLDLQVFPDIEDALVWMEEQQNTQARRLKDERRIVLA